MKIKLDENIPASVKGLLQKIGHNVETVPDESLTGETDSVLWRHVQAEQRFLITQDLDFSDIRQFSPGTHHGLLLVRLANPSRQNLTARIEQVFKTENVQDWKCCFVVVTDTKIRFVVLLSRRRQKYRNGARSGCSLFSDTVHQYIF